MLHQQREQEGDDPIDQRNGQVGLPIGGVGAGDGAGGIGQIRQADGGGQRRILDDGDGVVAQRRQHAPEGLRQDHLAHGLAVAHAQRARGFHLAAVDRLDPGAEDLRHIGAGVERDRHHAGEKGAVVGAQHAGEVDAHQAAGDQQAVARVDEQRHQRKVHHHDLHEQRGAAKGADVDAHRPLNAVMQDGFPDAVRRLRQAPQTEDQSPGGAQQHADNGAFDGHPGAFHKQRRVFLDDLPAEVQGVFLLGMLKRWRADGLAGAGGRALFRRQRRYVAVEPGLVDLGVGAVGDDFLQAGVDFVAQLIVAFGDGDAEILTFELGVGHQLEGFLRVGFDIELGHADVADRRADAVFIKLLQHQRGIVEAFDGGAVFAQHVGHHDVAGAGVDHADLQRFQRGNGVYLRVLRHHDGLLSREVRRRKINHLFAFIGDGDAGDDDIAIAGIQRGEDPFPRCIDQFYLETIGLGYRFDNVDVETFQLLLAVFKLERPIGAAGADDVGRFSRQRGGGEGGGQAGADQN